MSRPAGNLRGTTGHSSLKSLADDNLCQANDDMIVQIGAPTCWNGQLDSPDHRSHVAQEQNTGLGYFACPVTHPYHFPFFFLAIHWTLGPDGNNEMKKLYLSSDHMNGMKMEAGSTMHTDWFGAWDDNVATEWVMHADSDFRNCSGGDLCDGRSLKDPYQKTGMDGYNSLLNTANPRLVDPPVKP